MYQIYGLFVKNLAHCLMSIIMNSSKEILILKLVSFATCCRLEKNGLSKKISLGKITTCDVFHHGGLNFSESVGHCRRADSSRIFFG